MATSRIVDTRNLFDLTTIRRTGYSYTEEKASYENGFSCSCRDECHLLRSVFVPVGFHYTDDPLIRYIRDRRLHLAMNILARHGDLNPASQRVLVTCGESEAKARFLPTTTAFTT
jgi:hypothetical protein